MTMFSFDFCGCEWEEADEYYGEPYGAGPVPDNYLPGYTYYPKCCVHKLTDKSYLVEVCDKRFWVPKKAIAGPRRGLETWDIFIANWFLFNYLDKDIFMHIRRESRNL